MNIFGIVGWSGVGKTTLIVALLREFNARGLSVSTIKHTHHSVDLDQPGKDTWRHRQAGATEVVLMSASRWTLIHEVRDAPEPNPRDIAARLAPVDLLLTEGFKRSPVDKLEVFRGALGRAPLYPDDGRIVAVASDRPLADPPLPNLPLDDPRTIAQFIIRFCHLSM